MYPFFYLIVICSAAAALFWPSRLFVAFFVFRSHLHHGILLFNPLTVSVREYGHQNGGEFSMGKDYCIGVHHLIVVGQIMDVIPIVSCIQPSQPRRLLCDWPIDISLIV